MVKTVQKFGRVGGPSAKDRLKGYPGDTEFIKHLEKTTDFRYRTGELDPAIRKYLMGSGSSPKQRGPTSTIVNEKTSKSFVSRSPSNASKDDKPKIVNSKRRAKSID